MKLKKKVIHCNGPPKKRDPEISSITAHKYSSDVFLLIGRKREIET